jgi:hypothetical protein
VPTLEKVAVLGVVSTSSRWVAQDGIGGRDLGSECQQKKGPGLVKARVWGKGGSHDMTASVRPQQYGEIKLRMVLRGLWNVPLEIS